MIQGEIIVQVAGESHAVQKGDVLTVPGNQPHGNRNVRKSPGVAVSIVIPLPV